MGRTEGREGGREGREGRKSVGLLVVGEVSDPDCDPLGRKLISGQHIIFTFCP